VRVLVTGATGYIGSRLVPELVERGHEVFAAVRRDGGADRFAWSGDVTERRFDIEKPDLIRSSVEGIDAVVYLVHSMESEDFVRKDREAAEAMAAACEEAGVERIAYLSGLVPDGELSDHLRSRLEVERVFLGSRVPATVLRAAMVIGSGSTSFEGGVLATSTDKDGNPNDKEPVPNSPPPNYTRTGAVTHIGDKFKVVFNEQVEDGASITVNAVHEYLLGPAAVGEIIIGQSRCAIPPATPSASPAAQSSTESGSDAVPIVLGALGIALLAVIAVLTIRRSRTKREE